MNKEVNPEEIFLDSSNLPNFDNDQFEGRIIKPISRKAVVFIGSIFLIMGVVFAVKATTLQLVDGEKYKQIAENNRLNHNYIFAERGAIIDRKGELLAWNEIDPKQTDYSLRKYIEAPGFSSLLGYVKYPRKDKSGFYYNTELSGQEGIESYYSSVLQGENGLKLAETDARGKLTQEMVIRPPIKGEDIKISIDKDVQEQLYLSMKAVADRSGFRGGVGLIMDIESGEMLAAVSFPEFDSNVMTEGVDQEKIKGYFSNSANPFLDRISSGLYTPGSIMKPFFAFGALEEDIISPNKKILSTGEMRYPNPFKPGEYTVFKDWKAHGYTDMREAIAVSSDVYFYQVGGGFQDQKGLGIDKIDYYSRLFGFGESLDKGFFAGKKGLIPTPTWKEKTFDGDIWRIGDTYNTSIGQYGYQITPIQAVRATAALANNGTLVEPTLLTKEAQEEIGDSFDTNYQKIKISTKDEDHFQIVREGMRLAVTNGTMVALNLPGIKIAGKTGTAQLGTRNQFINSWAVGFFPYEKPKYAFAILLERAPNNAVAGAAPSVRHFFEWLALYKREYVDGGPSKSIPINKEPVLAPGTTSSSTLPNISSTTYSDIER